MLALYCLNEIKKNLPDRLFKKTFTAYIQTHLQHSPNFNNLGAEYFWYRKYQTVALKNKLKYTISDLHSNLKVYHRTLQLEAGVKLPSPLKLLYKILVKNKKQRPKKSKDMYIVRCCCFSDNFDLYCNISTGLHGRESVQCRPAKVCRILIYA